MLLLVAVLFLAFPRGDGTKYSKVCYDGLSRCLSIYIKDVKQHTTEKEICHDVAIFVRCLLELDCNLPLDVKIQSFHTVEMGLAEKGLRCERITELKATYLSGIPYPKSRQDPRSQSNLGTTKATTPSSTASINRNMAAIASITLACMSLFIVMLSK